MQITVSNLLASEALWATMTKLADRVVDGCACGLPGVFPYTVVHYKGSTGEVEHLTINASNANFRVSRILDVAEGTITYICQKGGYVGRVIKRHLELNGHSEVDAVQFFAGLINYIDMYRTEEGAHIRGELAKGETYSLLKNKARCSFYNQLRLNADMVLEVRAFFSQTSPLADVVQIADTGLVSVRAGVYVYRSLEGKGSVDTLVVKADNGDVAVIHLPKSGKFQFHTNSKQLYLMMDYVKGVGASFIDSLVDTNSFIHGLLNQVTVE